MVTRARDGMAEWVVGLADWDLYATLTYDPKRPRLVSGDEVSNVVAPSPSATKRHVSKWVAEASCIVGEAVGVAGGLEYHKNGWPHWHALVACGGVTTAEFTAMSAAWFKLYGFARFDRVDRGDVGAIARYVSKYLTKGSGDLVLLDSQADWFGQAAELLPGVSRYGRLKACQVLSSSEKLFRTT